ncbi:MAG: helicase-associated domain-containing protein [Chloroflexota bacterium]
MNEFRFRFDDYFDYVNANEVKALARLWGGRSNASKAEAIRVIQEGFREPVKIRGAVEALAPWERAALAILRQLGGMARYDTLGVGLIATGVPLPQNPVSPHELISALFKRGLLMSDHPYSPAYFSEYSSHRVWSDIRLINEAGSIPVQTLELPILATPEHTLSRRPAVVALDLLGILQAVDQLGGLQLTKNGSIRATEIRKLRKTLRWAETGIELDGFTMLDPTTAWVYALARSNLMAQHDERLDLRQSVVSFADYPIPKQVAIFLYGLINALPWLEIPLPNPWFDSDGNYRAAGRLALTIGLMALPTDGRPFYSLDDFDEAFYSRIGAHFSLDGSSNRPYYLRYESNPQAEAKWRAQRRAAWLKLERQWIEAALTGWLYFLGIVELACEGEHVIGLRLTELGRNVLHPELAPLPVTAETSTVIASNNPPWIVQPNFDIVVYLDQATPAQLAFLEQHAERQQAHQHTAHYLLTRQSIYRGLESGSSLEHLLNTIRAGSSSEIPQNVVIEIREWAALRERISVYRRASLLEFPSSKELQAALRKGWKGTEIAGRYLLLNTPAQLADQMYGATRIDYSLPLPKCLQASEKGQIQIKSKNPDLMIVAQLDRWAERTSDKSWQLTPSSIHQALSSSQKADQLIRLLSERLSHNLPRLLELAVRSWSGLIDYDVELAQVTVLHCANPFVFEAISTSKTFKPYFKGLIFPDILLIDNTQLEAFKKELDWLQLQVSEDLTVQPVIPHRYVRPR